MGEQQEFLMPKEAVGFSVYRFEPDRSYTTVKFEKGYASCEICLRRMKCFGYLSNQVESDGVVDVIDSNGDSIDSFFVTKKGLSYLYKKLNLRVLN